MARMPRVTGTSGIYHIIIRGAGHQILFESQNDGDLFKGMLKKYSREGRITIYGYCLMENHVHLLVHGGQPSLSEFMKRLAGSYALYFNEKYERVGTLFQSRFKSEPVEDEQYFLTVLRYIIMNPERAGLCQREHYNWSCYREYMGRPAICDISFAEKIAGSSEDLRQFLNSESQDTPVQKTVRKVSDEKAKEMIRQLFGFSSGTQLQAFSKKERNKAIRILKEKGVSIRQIERLTGVSRGVIQQAERRWQV